MIKQTLIFSNPAELSLRNGQMVISQRALDRDTARPIADIGIVIIENQLVRMTIPLLNELARNNAIVVLCDNSHLPQSILTSLTANSTQAETLRAQTTASTPLQKQAWKQVVEYKIRNQSALLDKLGKEGRVLSPYYNNVKSGDADNREGAAARIYWTKLFGDDFSRDRYGQPPNDLLNYGYSILHAATIRAILGSGLSAAFGIFHHNRYNPFPLGDDLMEPYRPFIDEIVFNLYKNNCYEIDRTSKTELVRALNRDVLIGRTIKPLQLALSSTTASFSSYLRQDIRKLSLPEFP